MEVIESAAEVVFVLFFPLGSFCRCVVPGFTSWLVPVFVRFAPASYRLCEQSDGRDPPNKRRRGRRSLSPLFFSLCRLLESSLLNAEVKEGEILPPTIQRLMKGYNKYLRPFFDSKKLQTHAAMEMTEHPGEMRA